MSRKATDCSCATAFFVILFPTHDFSTSRNDMTSFCKYLYRTKYLGKVSTSSNTYMIKKCSRNHTKTMHQNNRNLREYLGILNLPTLWLNSVIPKSHGMPGTL